MANIPNSNGKRAFTTRVVWLLLTFAATLAILVGSDKLAGHYFDGIGPQFPWQYLITYLLLALSISLSRGRWFRIAAVCFIVVLQLVWLGTAAYTGSFLQPEFVSLGTVQIFEIENSLAGEFNLFIPALVISGLVFAALLAVQEMFGANRAWRNIAGNILFVMLIAFGTARAVTITKFYVVYPGTYTPSIVGTLNAAALAFRPDFIKYADDPTWNSEAYSFRDIGITEEPVTVAVIMGESVAPLQMSLFAGRDIYSSPNLDALAANDGDHVLISRLGFSAGRVTIGSVPTFLNGTYHPADGLGSGDNLLAIAKKQGFATAFLSAQKIKSLELAGGTKAVDVLETAETWLDRLAEVRDDILLDHLDALPGGAARQFIFLHQRTNHASYVENCPKAFDAHAAMKAAAGDDLPADPRVLIYRTGLICYDLNVSKLLARLKQREGALYVFITADHNELMGEQGYYGHLVPILETALVPVMLYTNRPDSAVADNFRKRHWITAFELAQIVTSSLGLELQNRDYKPGVFYVNGLEPYGGAGYFEISENPDGSFRFTNYLANGSVSEVRESVRLSEAAYQFNKARYAQGSK